MGLPHPEQKPTNSSNRHSPFASVEKFHNEMVMPITSVNKRSDYDVYINYYNIRFAYFMSLFTAKIHAPDYEPRLRHPAIFRFKGRRSSEIDA
jgi:hypothetical protein